MNIGHLTYILLESAMRRDARKENTCLIIVCDLIVCNEVIQIDRLSFFIKVGHDPNLGVAKYVWGVIQRATD